MIRTRNTGQDGLLLTLGTVVAPAILLVTVLAMVLAMAERQNTMAAAEQMKKGEAVRAMLLESRRPLLGEYASRSDLAWTSATGSAATGYGEGRTARAALVIDAMGQPVVEAWGGSIDPWLPGEVFGTGFVDLLAAAREARTGEGAMAFLAGEAGAAIVGIARLDPEAGQTALGAAGADLYLVLVEFVGETTVASLRDAMVWPDLGIVADIPAGRDGLYLTDPAGSARVALAWQLPRPGHAAVLSALPALLLAVLLLAVGIWRAHRRMARSCRVMAEAEAEARRIAYIDPLTGILNRRGLMDLPVDLVGRVPHFLLVLDVEGFTEINDQMGHRVGDSMLLEVLSRIRDVLPPESHIARIGGDEFAVFGYGGHAFATKLGQDIAALVAVPLEYHGHSLAISARIGIAVVEPPKPGAQRGPGRARALGARAEVSAGIPELLRRADVALYHAKKRASPHVMIWSADLDRERHQEAEFAEEIRMGLAFGEFWVAFQPIYCLATRRVTGFEALARWTHPVRGPISPGDFVPAAERSRLIHELGLFVLREACTRIREFGPDITLSVNLSPVQMRDVFVAEKIEEVLRETGFPAGRLELEVTEGYLIDHAEKAAAILRRLKDLGVRISLDDFGAGFASLGYLRRFPVDKIKIDRSYVTSIEHDESVREVFAALVALARANRLMVTAEGVENFAQVRHLATTGVQFLQGWAIGRPEPEVVFETDHLRAVLGEHAEPAPAPVDAGMELHDLRGLRLVGVG